MIVVRKAAQRGSFDHGWLKTHHTFSFGEYQDPAHHHFRTLRVMNEDWIAPGQGFGMHPHRDMEIITYVLEGALRHKDSMGNGEILRAGEWQRMSAGTGIFHSEFNAFDSAAVHLYQIWLFPNRKDLPPSYEQRAFAQEEQHNRFRTIAAPEGRGDALTLHQDAELLVARLDQDATVVRPLQSDRHGWLQVLRGRVALPGDLQLEAGDGAAISNENEVRLSALEPSEVLLFDLA